MDRKSLGGFSDTPAFFYYYMVDDVLLCIHKKMRFQLLYRLPEMGNRKHSAPFRLVCKETIPNHKISLQFGIENQYLLEELGSQAHGAHTLRQVFHQNYSVVLVMVWSTQEYQLPKGYLGFFTFDQRMNEVPQEEELTQSHNDCRPSNKSIDRNQFL